MKVAVIYSTKKEIEVSDEFMPLVQWNHEDESKHQEWLNMTFKMDTELLKHLPENAIVESVTDMDTGELLYEQ